VAGIRFKDKVDVVNVEAVFPMIILLKACDECILLSAVAIDAEIQGAMKLLPLITVQLL
jgi:hypothetical protein